MGHLARHCPTVCFKCKGGHALDSCPNRRRWERALADEADLRSVASDFGAAVDVTGDPAETSTISAETADPASAASPAAAAGVTGNSVPGGPASNGVVLFDFLAPRSLPTPTVPQPGTAPDVDERLNQLDEIQTQDESPSPSVLSGLSSVVNEACESAIDALESAGGSVSDASLSGDSFVKPRDVCMSEPSPSMKRSTTELLSSDESHRSRSRSRKSTRVTSSHMPSGVSAAANLARSRSSSLSSRSPSVLKSSSKSNS